jgi:hypothetical protein
MSEQTVWKKVEGESPENDDGSEIWKPDNADAWISGEYFDKDENIGTQNNSTMYHIKGEKDGTHYKLWGSKVLNSRMDDVEIGKTVKIVYHGKTQSKGGNYYKLWDVFVAEEGSSKDGEKSPSSSSSSKPKAKSKPKKDPSQLDSPTDNMPDELRFEAMGSISDARSSLIGKGVWEPTRVEIEKELDRMGRDNELKSDEFGFSSKTVASAGKTLLPGLLKGE